MDVSVSSERRFYRTPDGAIWTEGECYYEILARYLEVFDRVNMVARVVDVDAPRPNQRRADGDGVRFSPLPNYLGPWQYLSRQRAVKRAIRAAIGPRDAVILSVPSHIATCIEQELPPGRPYALQVLSDPDSAFAPEAMRHPLRPVLRPLFTRNLQRQAQNACSSLYVTRQALQARYPCPQFMAGISDVDLIPEAFVDQPRTFPQDREGATLISVAGMSQVQKGQDVLIDAAAACIEGGVDLRIVLVGDGKHRPEYEARASRLGIRDRIAFRGQLPPGETIRAELDAADLFVFPSRSEGLPRAVVEAMARAMPCLASSVNGIPELLASEDLLPPGDVAALSQAIRQVVGDPARLQRMSARNLQKAREYSADLLQRQRTDFYRVVFERTAAMLAKAPLVDRGAGSQKQMSGVS